MGRKALKFDIRAEDKTALAFKSVKAKIGSLTGPLFSLKGAMVGALGALGLGAMAKNTLDTADKMDKLNKRLGVSVEGLSKMKYAAEMSGITFETLTMAMQRSTRRIAEAAVDTGEAKDALQELGLDANELNMMKPDEQILAIADAMDEVSGEADKVRLAMKLFDSEGVALLQMLNEGRIGMEEMMDAADELGVSLDQATVQDMAAAKEAIDRMKTSFAGVGYTLMAELAPFITDTADGIAYWVAENRELLGQRIPEYIDDLRYYFDVVVEFFKNNQSMLKMGVVGYFLFGPMGAAVGALLGSTLDKIKTLKGELASGSYEGPIEGRSGYERIRDWSQGGSFWGDESQPAAGTPGALDARRGVNINVNQQVSRSDVNAIANEAARQEVRQ